MSKDKINTLNWSDRFALIDKYEPSDDAICNTLGLNSDELDTARDLRASGNFQAVSEINVDDYADMFKNAAKNESVTAPTRNSGITSHVKPTTKSTAPLTSTKPVKEAKKRGRKGSKISEAFVAIPTTAIPAEQFAEDHEVSLAVLRQSRRFDKSGLGPVRVKKDKETKQLMIWREVEEG